MKVDTGISYEENLLSDYASYFEGSLMWAQVGQKYLEEKHGVSAEDSHDDGHRRLRAAAASSDEGGVVGIFTTMHEII